MNLFYLCLILSFTSMLMIRNKKIGLLITFILMIVPWCFQYQMTQDWDVNLLRWDFVNVNALVGLDGEDRQLEPFYVFILERCKFLGFFGFLILCGLVELIVIFTFIRKYVSPGYYWVAVFILMMKVNYGLLLINSNRQTLSVISIMLGVYFMLKCRIPRALADKSNLYILNTLFFFYAAPRIHSSAYISYMLIPVYMLLCYVKRPNRVLLLVIFNGLYVSRFFVDAGSYQFFASMYLDSLEMDGMDFFDKYLEGLDNDDLVSSRFNQLVEWSMMNSIILCLHKMSNAHRLFGFAWIISYILGGFLIHTLARITIYFYVFLLFVAPRVFEIITDKFDKRNTILISIYITMVVFFVNNFRVNMVENDEGRYYYRWHDFKTLFEAPEWL